MNQVDDALSKFAPDDYTVRLCSAIFGSIPLAPRQPSYRTMGEAIQVLYPAATPPVVARTNQLAAGEGVKDALWMASALDTGDTGIAIYSGMKSALGFFFGENKSEAFETDKQQGVDSALKLLGMAYMITKLFPGSLADRVRMFQSCPAGQALTFYYATIEVALPFADNAIMAGGNAVQTLVSRYGGDATGKLSSVANSSAAAEASGMMQTILGPIEGIVQQVAPHARTVANAAARYVPGVANTVDKVAGAVATAADALDVYRYLGGRLACESCILVASRGM